jgi:hypothetical protein
MTIDYDNEIKKATQQFNSTIARMEKIHKTFLGEAKKFIKKWYIDITKKKVTKETELTKELGLEKLSFLKSEVKSLQDTTDESVEDFIARECHWWHLEQSDKPIIGFQESVYKAMRLIAGRLGPVLESYGYLTNDPSEPAYWREWDKLEINRPPNARPYYPHHLDWPKEMENLIHEYEELMKDGIQYRLEIKKLKDQKAKHEAEDLWSQA